MAAKTHLGSLGSETASPNIDMGTLSRRPSTIAGPIGVPGVRDWPLEKRLGEVAGRAAPLVPGEMREQFIAMFSPGNIAVMIGFMAVIVGIHMTPFAIAALIADALTFLVGAVLIGAAIIDVSRDLATFAAKTQNATTHQDLQIAAVALARAVSVLGVTVLTAFIAKNAGRAVRAVKRRAASASSSRAPRLYEMIKLEHTGDGVMAEAMRKAAVKEIATEKVLARNQHWEMKGKPGQLKSRGGVDAKGNPIRPRQLVDSYADGHKLTRAMGQRTLPAGTEIIQFVHADGKVGVWCAYPGARPADLAIIAKGRIQMRFVVEKPLTAWESTAAQFETGMVEGVGGRGGGRQLWMPEGWRNNVRSVWEAGATGTFGAGTGATARQRR